MKKSTTRASIEVLADIRETIAEANTAITEKRTDDYLDEMAQLSDLEKEYSHAREVEVYKEYAERYGADATVEIIKLFAFRVYGHKVELDYDFRPASVRLEDKECQVDLMKFCQVNGMSTDWKYKMNKFGQLLCLNLASDIAVNKERLKEIASTYYMADNAERKVNNSTAYSKTQLMKMLQGIIDEITGKPGEYKPNNADLKVILACMAKRSNKDRLTLVVAKERFIIRLVADVIYRIITGGIWDLKGFKLVKAEKLEAKNEPAPAPTPAPVATVETVEAEAVAA